MSTREEIVGSHRQATLDQGERFTYERHEAILIPLGGYGREADAGAVHVKTNPGPADGHQLPLPHPCIEGDHHQIIEVWVSALLAGCKKSLQLRILFVYRPGEEADSASRFLLPAYRPYYVLSDPTDGRAHAIGVHGAESRQIAVDGRVAALPLRSGLAEQLLLTVVDQPGGDVGEVVGPELVLPPAEMAGVVSRAGGKVGKDMLGVAVDQIRQGPFRRFRAQQVASGLDGGFVLLGPSNGVRLPVEGLGLPGVSFQAYIGRVTDVAVLGETLVDGGHVPCSGVLRKARRAVTRE